MPLFEFTPDLVVITIFLSCYLLTLFYQNLIISRFTDSLKNSKKKNSLKLQSVKNSVAVAKNDTTQYQKIKTSEIILPVIKATVLEYAPGELGESFPENTKLYYSEEALKDKEFLETVIRSPWQVETHEKNTGEFNRSVDGWARESWYDEKDKTVYAKGFLLGENNVEYAKENKDKPGFGTSAFISFLKIDKENGTTPEGLEYSAIAIKAVCNHVAILPNIRDEKNKIVSINAKNAIIETKKLHGVKNMAINMDEFKEAMQAYQKEAENEDKLVDKIKNAVLEEIEKKNAKNTDEEKKEEPKKEVANEDKAEEKKEEPKKEAENEDHKEPDGDEGKGMNALPSEKLVATFCNAYNTRFPKTPSFVQLAELAEIETKGKTLVQVISSVNSKFLELSSNVSSATNSTSEKPKTIEEALKGF